MKAYTNIEQSKKLAEILPLESADMYFDGYGRLPQGYAYTLISPNSFEYDIPCWSLAALLDVIPKRIKDYNVLRIDISNNDFSVWYDEIGHGVNRELPDIEMNEPVDVCVEMILELHKLKML